MMHVMNTKSFCKILNAPACQTFESETFFHTHTQKNLGVLASVTKNIK